MRSGDFPERLATPRLVHFLPHLALGVFPHRHPLCAHALQYFEKMEPPLAKLCFEPSEPSKLWQECSEALRKWTEQKEEDKPAKVMKEFRRTMAMKSVILANTLEDTLPKGLSEKRAEELLNTAYGSGNGDVLSSDEPGFYQIWQHLQAFEQLLKNLPHPLTEEVIKRTHGVMMQGLKSEDSLDVNAGVYRTIPVHAGSIYTGYHQYPSWKDIPGSMLKIVEEYEQRQQDPDHDPYALASWLYFTVVTLHPFVDGNGRISRLLWCYSLMQDGLPFPTTLTSGHRRAQKHLLYCLKRDNTRPSLPHITALTVVSCHKAWQQCSLT